MRKIRRYLRRLHAGLLPLSIIGIVALGTAAILLSLNGSPRAPKLKSGSGDSLYVASNTIYSSAIGTKSGDPQVTFSVGSSQASFIMAGIDKVTPRKESSTSILFPSVQKDTDLRYTTTPNGLKEELILRSAPKSNVYLFDFLLNNVTPKKLTNDFIDPSFKDDKGTYLFHFDKPFAVDANGNRTNNVLLQIGEDKSIPDKYYLKLIVDPSWLSDPARVYPIVIDPTILHDTTAEFVAGTLNRLKDTGPGATATLETYYQELPADQYTVGLWHMNEASGNVADSSGNGNTGTPNGTTVLTGLLGNARSFAGSTDDIALSSINLGTSWTMEAWVNRAAGAGTKTIMDFNDNSNICYLRIGEVTANAASFACSGSLLIADTTNISDGNWHHVVGVRDGSMAYLYVDGKLVGSDTSFTTASFTSSYSSRIGREYWAAAYYVPFDGKIDEVRISNIARTPEEIKSSASRRPYSVYTSDVLDLGGAGNFVTTWNPLQWSEHGVNTGDGETLKSSTNLVAQWNFNDTPSTATTVSGGSCGTSCNGTLTSFSNTTAYDVVAGSGWTSANHRWGAGALMFDGSNDYVSVPTSLTIGAGDVTVAAWIKRARTGVGESIFDNWNGAGNELGFDISSGDKIHLWFNSEAGTGSTSLTSGMWYYVVGTRSGSTTKLYVNGVQDGTGTNGNNASQNGGAIGAFGNGSGNRFNGTIDSVQIYSRALGAAEIMSNYQAANIEFQTRVGADTSPDDGSWEAWKPTTGETQIDSMDTDMENWAVSTSTVSGLPVSIQNINPTAPSGPTGCTNNRPILINNLGNSSVQTNYQVKLNIAYLAGMDASFADLRFTNASGTNLDYWLESHADSVTATVWVEVDSIPANANKYIYMWYGSCSGGNASNGTNTMVLFDDFEDGSINAMWSFQGLASYTESAGSLNLDANTNTWSNYETGAHVSISPSIIGYQAHADVEWVGLEPDLSQIVLRSKTTGGATAGFVGINDAWAGSSPGITSYVEGGQSYSTTYDTQPLSGRKNFDIYHNSNTYNLYFDNRQILVGTGSSSSNEIVLTNTRYTTYAGKTAKYHLFWLRKYTSPEPTANVIVKPVQPYIEGTGSLKIETAPQVDGSTVALWHLDETSGNANNSTALTGLTLTATNNPGSSSGFSGRGRSLVAASSQYFTCTDANCGGTTKLDPNSSTGWSMGGWVYANTFPGTAPTLMIKTGSGTGPFLMVNTSGQLRGEMGNVTCNNDTAYGYQAAATLPLKKWTHVVMTVSAANPGILKLYMDGSLKYTSAASAYYCDQTGNFYIGSNAAVAGYYWDGNLDEMFVASTTLSEEQIAEAYRAGRDHYINKTISSTDLSGKSTLPFYVAADRPGSYLSATIGESAYANYQPDANTVGLWHLAEQSGSGAYIKDSSGNGNHGSISGTSFAQGKIGKARSFAATNYITIPDNNSLDVTNQITLDAWIYPTSNSAGGTIMTKTGWGHYLERHSDGTIRAYFAGTSSPGYHVTTGTTPLNTWSHVAATYDGSNVKLYINGILDKVIADTGSTTVTTGELRIGSLSGLASGYDFVGMIDEARLSNTARSADEIRQAYEVGLRTHPITIDFGAKLDSGNLITGSGDLGFTVDATYYGLQNKGDMLFKGDKVIVRENYDGTEYIAQGTVDSITASTGATTVSAWDSGSTFPSGGYTVNASVFKWQREYWNINNETLDSHTNAITNLSLRLTDGAEGRTIYLDDLRSTGGYLTDSSGSTITSSTGSRYMQYRSILSSFDEAVSATLSAVTVDYVLNTTPTTPSLDAPSDTATNQILSTVLKTTSTDADSDYLRYKIQLCTDLAMTLNCQTFDQTSSQTGWSGQDAQTSTAYTSGTQATYTLQTPLTVATTYYWRSYAIDPAGVNAWSGTQTPYSFTTTTAPTAPTVPYAEGASNPTGIIDLTPEFSGVHNDPNADAANFYEIEVNTDIDFVGTVMWDSNQTAMTSTANGVRSPDISYAGTALSYNGATYYWRIRFTDVGGATSAWSATQNFSTNLKPGTPTLDTPTNAAINQSLTPTLKTTTTDADSDYVRYKIEFCTDLAMTLDCQTFDQTSSQTGWSGQDAQTSTAYASGTQATYTLNSNLTINTTYYWRSYAIDPGGTNTWTTTQTPSSFVTRTLNEGFSCLIHETTDDSSLTIVWIDRETEEDSYKLERNVDGAGFSAFQTLAANTTSYQDTGISSGHTYAYRVAPYVSAGSTYGSWCTTSTLSLQVGILNYSGLNFSGFNLN